MAQLNSELILAALATIKDPATGKDLVEAGMIQGLQEKDGHVAFAIEIDPAGSTPCSGWRLWKTTKVLSSTVRCAIYHGGGK